MSIRQIVVVSIVLAFGSADAAIAQIANTPLTESAADDNQRYGTRGASFLEIGVGARASALGGAVAADVEGVPALYWNTAGIARTERARVGFTMTELYDDFDISLGHVGALLPLGGGVAGLSITFLSSGEMERTTVEFPSGGDPLFGESFSYRGTAASFHYARLLTDRLALGGAIRYAQEGIDGAAATYVGIDVGTQFATGLYGVTIGAAINNMGTDGQFRGNALRRRLTDFPNTTQNVADVQLTASSAAMPMVFRFSVATDLLGSAEALIGPDPQHTLRAVGDVSEGISTSMQSAFGLEYSFRDLLFLRGGKRFMNEGAVAPWTASHGTGFGGGLRLPIGDARIAFDYAYQPWGELNDVQIFSFEFAF